MANYAVYLHLDLLESVPKRGSQRDPIMKFVRSLAENPFLTGDYTDQDNSKRTRQVKIVGDYAITWWADHASKAVYVIDVTRADR